MNMTKNITSACGLGQAKNSIIIVNAKVSVFPHLKLICVRNETKYLYIIYYLYILIINM